MTEEQLFEDYDPDMEDVFGRKTTMTAKRVTVTEQQKMDPLRKPKVELQGILVAEKQPITSNDVVKRMLNEYGQVLDPKKYGCQTMDDLLQACSDTVVHKRRQDGVHIYWAKVSEANQDIVEMVQQQASGHEFKKTPKSFLSYGRTKGVGCYGAAFRQYKGQERVQDAAKPAKTTPEQHKARSKLGPAKTADRLRNMSDLLTECRSEIGKPHPEDPNRIIVTLGALMEKFKQVYGLPAWGKNMAEGDLYNLINVPEFAGIFKFWRFRDGGDIYVEEEKSNETLFVEEKKNEQKPAEPIEIPQAPLQKDEANEPVAVNPTHDDTCSRSVPLEKSFDDDFSSISATSSAMGLISEAAHDGFFESGPGFGGNRGQRPQTAPSQNPASSTWNAGSRGENARTNENPNSAPSSRNTSRQDTSFRTGDQTLVGEEAGRPLLSSTQPARTIPPSIIPKNPVRVLADYFQKRGPAKFESLPDDDKVIVNFNSHIFKVYATQPGEKLVCLVDPAIVLSTIDIVGNSLRDPIEDDLIWMSEATQNFKRGRRYVKPVMFIAPRGFLLMVSNPGEEELDSDNMTQIENLLRGAMAGSVKEIKRKHVRPGMAAVYIYRQDSEVRYYRVLVTGKANNDGDVMVLLADHNDQYIVDVQLAHLFELPEKASFRHYPPNVIFATLFSVLSMSIEEQEVMWKNFDDEERKRFIVGVVPNDDSKLLSVDMVLKNEFGQFEWLSQIAKRRGAVVSNASSAHLSKSPSAAIERFGPDCYIEFCDYRQSPQVNGAELGSRVDSANQSHQAEEVVRSRAATPGALPAMHPAFSPRNLDVYALFEEMMERRDEVPVGTMMHFARAIKRSMGDHTEWTDLIGFMDELARRYNFTL